MKSNTEKLAELINSRIHAVVQGQSTVTTEIGTINANLGLLVASVNDIIERDSYYLTSRKPIVEAGDKVLVIWVGSIPIIIDTLIEP